MEGFGGLVVLAVLYGLLDVLGKIMRQRRERGEGPVAKRPSRAHRLPQAPLPPAPPEPPEPDGTQQEGATLADWLRELEALAQGRPAPGPRRLPAPPPATGRGRAPVRRPATPLPGAEEVEERGSLEEEPVVVSIEVGGEPVGRPVVDLDDEAERAVERRVREAEARNRPLSLADHEAFERRLRAEAAARETEKRRGAGLNRLREAFLWREVLGPPVGLRDEPS